MRRVVTLGLLALAVTAAAAGQPRFFVMGTGSLALVNGHTDETWRGAYRRGEGGYERQALEAIRRVFGSRNGEEAEVSLRLVEVLSHLQHLAGDRPLVLVSGYRSAAYNEGLRARGAQAASGSLHTEGLAADVALPRAALHGLWLRLRALECCGVGHYAKDGFLHVDVGRPRFWEPATSRVGENLSAGNARLFARTEYDRYAAGERVVVALHALTEPPVRIARTARLVPETGAPLPVRLGGSLPEAEGCLEAIATGVRLEIADVPPAGRSRLVLETCAPRSARTPETVESNPLEIGPPPPSAQVGSAHFAGAPR
jgi:uncharacterized protein YcbK (DUF882 family)